MTSPPRINSAGGFKHYAVGYDISPSEQLGIGANSKRSLGFAVPMGSRGPLEEVGEHFELRKWSGAAGQYKAKFVEFLLTDQANEPPTLLTGRVVVNERVIRSIGRRTYQELLGPLREPIDHNRAGKPRVAGPGGFEIGGEIVKSERILIDDLLVICWLTNELASLG